MSYYGAEKEVENYDLRGPVKAELGRKRIRAHAISPGPLKTRAAFGIAAFDDLLMG